MMKKSLSYSEYLQALALFTVSKKHYDKSREMELELCEALEFGDDGYAGCISDAIVNDGDFDSALSRQGIKVEPKDADKAA
jgi:hypothetical protein